MKKPFLMLALLGLTAAQAQNSTFTMNPPSSLYVTSTGSVHMPFKFYEVAGSEVPRLKRDVVLNAFYDAISEYVRDQGYNAPCMSRDAFMLRGTPTQLKTMQKQWITTLANKPTFFKLVDSSIGDTARDADDSPITLDTYLMKGKDDQNYVRSFTFITYPTKKKTWLLTCRSGNF